MRNGAYSIYDQGMYDILQKRFKLIQNAPLYV